LVHDSLNLIGLSLEGLFLLGLNKLTLIHEWLTLLAWEDSILGRKLNELLLWADLSVALEESLHSGILLNPCKSGSSLGALLLEENIVSVFFMVELNELLALILSVVLLNGSQVLLVKKIILIGAVSELNILSSHILLIMVIMVLSPSLSHSLSLGIDTFIVFVEEAVIVTIWSQFSIVKGLVVVANSWHVLWSVGNIWVVWRPHVLSLSTVESLSGVIKIEPVGTLLGLVVEWGL